MSNVSLVIVLCLALSANDVAFAQMAGAQHRHHASQEEYNIDDVIRAEEDPNFEQYLKDREREKKERRAAALEYKKQLRAEKRARYQAYLQYVKERREKAAREKSSKPKKVVDENKLWEQQQEKYRLQYLESRAKELRKHEAERIVRLQKARSLERMPASE